MDTGDIIRCDTTSLVAAQTRQRHRPDDESDDSDLVDDEAGDFTTKQRTSKPHVITRDQVVSDSVNSWTFVPLTVASDICHLCTTILNLRSILLGRYEGQLSGKVNVQIPNCSVILLGDRSVKQVVFGIMEGSSRSGRPRRRWIDDVDVVEDV